MKINRITPNIQNIRTIKPDINENQNTFQPENKLVQEKLPMPTTAQYLSFTGGYSLDLAQTIKNLDKLAQRYSDIYPPNIREWAGMILENGNKEKQTLIGVHKKLYENIKSCFNLKELKEKFPEFKDVKSTDDINYQEGSFIDDVKKGKIDVFNPEEDLTLQIIKLYWGEGFSLNDLKAYAGGKDLYHTMERLNIPTVNRHYGHILKFSDPEYNERLTKQMAQKRMESMDIKAQKADGEPVYIKRGPLSAEHKKHISEGLLKYYQQYPEKIFAMSERQKQFYQDNPEQRQILHRVMIKAWNVFGADRIKQALSKYMKGKGFKNLTIDDFEYPTDLNKEKSAAMKKFWAENEWARKAFSKNMEYAWKKVKEEQDMFYIVDITPKLFKRKFFNWARKEGIDTSDISFEDLTYYPHRLDLNIPKSSSASKYTPKFIDSCPGDESQKMANTYQLSLIKFGHELKALENADVSKDTKYLARDIRDYLKYSLFDFSRMIGGYPTVRVYDAHEIQRIYTTTLTRLMDQHENKLIKKLNELLNLSYEKLDKNWKQDQPLLLSPDASNF